jgi:outer membrane protein
MNKEPKKVNHNLKRIFAVTAGMILLPALGAWAQGNGTAAAPAPVKLGVLNVRNAIVSTGEGKQASAELQSQFAPRQNDLESLNKQIEDVRNRLSAGQRTLSEDEKLRLQRQGEQATRQLERKQTELQEDLNAAQSEIIDRIGRKMMDVLDRYARENGFTVILDSSSQNTPLIYNSGQGDVTQEIIRLYDQAYPVKGGAPATTTPARPASTQPGIQPRTNLPGTTPRAPRTTPPAQQKPPQQ